MRWRASATVAVDRERDDAGRHDVDDGGAGERIDAVVAADAQPPAAELLGHQAVLVHRAVHEVGDDGGEHQRQDHVVVAGELEHEHDRGERGLGRGAERGGHGDDGERAERDVRTRAARG